ncbi:MAG: hypothetical protein AB7D51_09315, partial [Desulfovibrionaceae bacterium]
RDFQLWEVYTRRCMEGLRRCGSAGLVMRYEGLLETPGEQLDRMASFCGLDPARTPEVLAAVGINSGNGERWRRVPWIADLPLDTALLGELGYAER